MIAQIRHTTNTLRGIRIGLVLSGISILVAGILCVLAPIWFIAPVEWVVGGAMCLSGLMGVFHLLIGYISSFRNHKLVPSAPVSIGLGGASSASIASERGTAWTLILMQIALGGAMLWWPKETSSVLFFVLPVAVAIEGGIVFWLSLHFHSQMTKIWMWTVGLLSIVVAGAAMYYWKSPDAHRLLALLIGSKLTMVGLVFCGIGFGASDSDLQCAYVGLTSFQDEPIVGSIYAVYYGPAFHCGVSVDGGRVVDYLTDGIVRCVSWEEFLLGRRAMEWNYPDISPGSSSDISAFAMSLVGKYTRYDALKFNCENMAIYCRSVGTTTFSNFSQAEMGVELVRQRPLLGSMLQLFNRGASWFLYGAGGPFGKKVGFIIIRIARVMSDWVVARPMRSKGSFETKGDFYSPQFEDRKTGQPT